MAASRPQLHMIFPEPLLPKVPAVCLSDGYKLRIYAPVDLPQYAALMAKAGFGNWDANRIETMDAETLADGFFVVEHTASGTLVATALAGHKPSKLHPHGGELGYVAADPGHKGKGLGAACCLAVLNVFARRGYKHVYLTTDDERLPAIAIYLKLGFEPLLHAPDMAERWKAVRTALAGHK